MTSTPATGTHGETPDEGPTIQGKVAILLIAVLGVGGAVGSWLYYARLQQRPLALWGSPTARLMMQAPAARALRLAPAEMNPSNGRRVFEIAGHRWQVVDDCDVSHAPGFLNIRNCFVHDRSFAWYEARADCQPHYAYALEFADGEQRAVLALDLDCARAQLVGRDEDVSIRPVVGEFKSFLREQFPTATPAADQTSPSPVGKGPG